MNSTRVRNFKYIKSKEDVLKIFKNQDPNSDYYTVFDPGAPHGMALSKNPYSFGGKLYLIYDDYDVYSEDGSIEIELTQLFRKALLYMHHESYANYLCAHIEESRQSEIDKINKSSIIPQYYETQLTHINEDYDNQLHFIKKIMQKLKSQESED